ncbi:MAG: hypothetical protein K8M05_41800 [Deltaproteobacteria bacterium]|nr:hypothetical protein [Kofleriaceae bacterium]
MYSSIDKVDLFGEADGKRMAVQLDHRSAEEIEANPELSVLVVLARIINAREVARQNDLDVEAVVYAPVVPPPPFMLEALATVGAQLQDLETLEITPVAPHGDPAELADHMFAALSAIVCERYDRELPDDAITALEEDVSGRFGQEPDEDHEIEYWTAVLELMALTGEVIRRRVGGSWVVTEHGSVPFGFRLPSGSLLLPGNRAQRALAEGPEQGMQALLYTLDEMAQPASPTADGPILPSLRSRAEAVSGGFAFRPLFERMPAGADAPVLCWGHDSERLFAPIREEAGETIDEAAALANLRAQAVTVDEVEVAGMTMLSVGGSFFASEKLLDADFMRELAARLGDELLGCAIPRRHVLLVTGLGKHPANAGLLSRIAAGDLAASGARPICPHVILIQDGAPVGMVLPDDGSVVPPPDESPKKRGFFSRLFGRGSST